MYPIHIHVIDYTKDHFEEKSIEQITECYHFRDTESITWINIDGIHDANIIESIGNHFGVHPIVLEDIMNTSQRPKIEIFEKYIFLVFKMLYRNDVDHEIQAEQFSIILGKNFVISFQEDPGDIFDPIRDRIRTGKGRIRKMGADYLAYSLFDAVVDNYFVILEDIGEAIERTENHILENVEPETVRTIQGLKSDMIFLRKSIWPLREVVNSLLRGDSKLISKSTGIYLRDVYDHTFQVIDTIETFRDMLSGLFDMYMSGISNKMNEVMKILTIFTTIFIPLSFVTGLYGMNFSSSSSPFNMPELEWYFGYPLVLLIMLSISLTMIWYFKQKKWI